MYLFIYVGKFVHVVSILQCQTRPNVYIYTFIYDRGILTFHRKYNTIYITFHISPKRYKLNCWWIVARNLIKFVDIVITRIIYIFIIDLL